MVGSSVDPVQNERQARDARRVAGQCIDSRKPVVPTVASAARSLLPADGRGVQWRALGAFLGNAGPDSEQPVVPAMRILLSLVPLVSGGGWRVRLRCPRTYRSTERHLGTLKHLCRLKPHSKGPVRCKM